MKVGKIGKKNKIKALVLKLATHSVIHVPRFKASAKVRVSFSSFSSYSKKSLQHDLLKFQKNKLN